MEISPNNEIHTGMPIKIALERPILVVKIPRCFFSILMALPIIRQIIMANNMDKKGIHTASLILIKISELTFVNTVTNISGGKHT